MWSCMRGSGGEMRGRVRWLWRPLDGKPSKGAASMESLRFSALDEEPSKTEPAKTETHLFRSLLLPGEH